MADGQPLVISIARHIRQRTVYHSTLQRPAIYHFTQCKFSEKHQSAPTLNVLLYPGHILPYGPPEEHPAGTKSNNSRHNFKKIILIHHIFIYLLTGMKDTSLYDEFVAGRISGVYHSFFRPLVSFAQRYLGSEYSYIAEDVVQEAILQTYLRKDRINDPSSLKSYLYHSVRNSSLNILRKKNAHLNYLKAFDESDADITHKIIEEETFRILMEAIRSLDQTQREMLGMIYFESLKTSEIACKLGISEIAVKKRKSKLIRELRQILSDKGLSLLVFAIIVANISENTLS